MGKHRTLKPVPEAALGAVRDTLREHGEPIVAGPGQAMTFMQARTANEVLKAQERRVRLQRMKGELVAGPGRSAGVPACPRGARCLGELAGAGGGDDGGRDRGRRAELHTVLERHVRDHLGELAEIRPNLR